VSLATSLEEAVGEFVALIEPITAPRWNRVPAPGVWSVGKESAHVVEGMIYHRWIVRLTIGEKVSSRRPAIERDEMTTTSSPREMVALLQECTAETAALVTDLTDRQLDLATRPSRANGATLAETIERVMIGHVRVHTEEIKAKLVMR
jgi:uncharacterized damage-inducible protein DinB